MTPIRNSLILNSLNTIVNHISDQLILIAVGPDESYRVLFVNEAFYRSVGYRDIVGKEVRDILTPEEYDPLHERYKQAKTTKQVVTWQTTSQVPNGLKTYGVKLIPILNTLGECVQLVAITQEVGQAQPAQEKES